MYAGIMFKTKKGRAVALLTIASVLMLFMASLALWRSWRESSAEEDPTQTPPLSGADLYAAPDDRGLWGYINKQGRFVIQPVYDAAYNFHGSVAWVCANGLWGAVDCLGNFTVPCQMTDIRFLGHDFVVADDGTYASIYDAAGQKIIGVEGSIGAYSDGLFVFSRLRDNVELYGYLDDAGNVVTEPIYAAASACVDGHMLVQDNSGVKIILNSTGGEVGRLPAEYTKAFLGKNSVAFCNTAGLWGYCDFTGHTLIEPQFASAGPMIQGAALVEKNNLWGLIDDRGNWLVEAKFHSARNLGEGLFILGSERYGQGQLYNYNGILLAQNICFVSDWQNGFLTVCERKTSYLIDKYGQEIFLPWQGTYNWQPVQKLLLCRNGDSLIYYKHDSTKIYSQGYVWPIDTNTSLALNYYNPDYYLQLFYPQLVINNASGDEPYWQRRINNRLERMALDDWEDEYLLDSGLPRYLVKSGSYVQLAGNVASCAVWTEAEKIEDGLVVKGIKSLAFNSRTGEIFSLSDLFLADIDWEKQLLLPVLNAYLASAAAEDKQQSVLVQQALNSISLPDTPWLVGDNGLTLFISYGQSAEDFVAVDLTYALIETLIDKEGDLYLALQGEDK